MTTMARASDMVKEVVSDVVGMSAQMVEEPVTASLSVCWVASSVVRMGSTVILRCCSPPDCEWLSLANWTYDPLVWRRYCILAVYVPAARELMAPWSDTARNHQPSELPTVVCAISVSTPPELTTTRRTQT